VRTITVVSYRAILTAVLRQGSESLGFRGHKCSHGIGRGMVSFVLETSVLSIDCAHVLPRGE